MFIFDRDIALTQKDDSNFAGIISPNWSINGNPNGGYLTAFLAAAMQKKNDKKWPAIVTAQFSYQMRDKKIVHFRCGNYFYRKAIRPVSGKPDSGWYGKNAGLGNFHE